MGHGISLTLLLRKSDKYVYPKVAGLTQRPGSYAASVNLRYRLAAVFVGDKHSWGIGV